MYAVATFLVVAVITLALGQLATGASIATGVPPEIAAFQARSAFSGAGFTASDWSAARNRKSITRFVRSAARLGRLHSPRIRALGRWAEPLRLCPRSPDLAVVTATARTDDGLISSRATQFVEVSEPCRT